MLFRNKVVAGIVGATLTLTGVLGAAIPASGLSINTSGYLHLTNYPSWCADVGGPWSAGTPITLMNCSTSTPWTVEVTMVAQYDLNCGGGAECAQINLDEPSWSGYKNLCLGLTESLIAELTSCSNDDTIWSVGGQGLVNEQWLGEALVAPSVGTGVTLQGVPLPDESSHYWRWSI
jgi:hypothetical protein